MERAYQDPQPQSVASALSGRCHASNASPTYLLPPPESDADRRCAHAGIAAQAACQRQARAILSAVARFVMLAGVLAGCGRVGYAAQSDAAVPLILNEDRVTVTLSSPPMNLDVMGNDEIDRSSVEALSLVDPSTAFSLDDRGTPNDPSDDEVRFTQPPWAHGEFEATYRVTLRDGRTASAAVVVTVPCMTVDESVAGELRVEAVERFAVVFEEARFWEVGRWYDLQYDPEQDLGGNDSAVGQMKLQVLHQLIAVQGPVNWVNIGSGPAQRPIVRDASVSTVTIETNKILRRDEQADVFLTGWHTFDCDGNWRVSSRVIPDAPSMNLRRWEYAMTTANPELSWIESREGFLRWELSGAGPLAPIFEVYPDPAYPDALIQSDGLNNLYFFFPPGSYPISPESPLEASWRNVIWRPR